MRHRHGRRTLFPIPIGAARHSFAVGLTLVLLCPAWTFAQRVIYVNGTAGGANDGSSWPNAFAVLQDALDAARVAGNVDAEIWIAAGTYKPDRGTGDQTLAYELFGNVALYGGFAGWEECRDERDPGVNITTLSGDLNGDDDPDAGPLSDCCVLAIPKPSGSCSDPECFATVVAQMPSCAERWRQICTGTAVAVCCQLCRPMRCDNTFNVVRATEPGSAPSLDGVTIFGGEAVDPRPIYGYAGGMYSIESSPRVTGCTFVRNTGGGLYTLYGSPAVDDSLFMDNGTEVAESIAVTIDDPVGPITLKALGVRDNSGRGVRVIHADVTIVGCTFLGNSDGIWCQSSNCTVVDSRVVDNRAWGMYSDGYVRLFGSVFLRNGLNGLFTNGPALIVNSVFAGNTGGFGAAVSAGFGGVYVLNSVFYGNSANLIGGIGVGDGGATIRNSILWGNFDVTGLTQYAQIRGNDRSIINVRNSIVQGWTGDLGGVGNSGVDPMFVDALGPDGIAGTEDDDLHLLPGSPAINAGDPSTAGLPSTDLDGHSRVRCGRVDIGAYEFGIGDYNCDRAVDLGDFANWSACMTGPHSGPYGAGCQPFDFNADSAVDLLDFAALQSALSPPGR